MCEGTENSPSAQAAPQLRQTPQRHHRPAVGNTPSGPRLSAWDRPPPVASPLNGWKPRQLISRTPQHLVTLLGRSSSTTQSCWSAPPVLWKESYLIAATSTGQLLFWNLNHIVTDKLEGGDEGDDQQQVEQGDASNPNDEFYHSSSHRPGLSPFAIHVTPAPHLVLETINSQGPFTVESSALGAGTSVTQVTLASPSFLLGREALVTISVCGLVSVIVLLETFGGSDTVDDSIRASVVHSWTTGRTGMQCVTVTDDGLVVVGYKSGQLETWTLKHTLQHSRSVHQPKDVSQPSDSKTLYTEELVWRAAFENAPVIRSVLQMRMPTARNDDSSLESTETSPNDDYLVLTLQQESRTPTACMVEVVNTALIHQAWSKQQARRADDTPDQPEVYIEDYCILAQAGMEVLNSLTIPSSNGPDDLPKRSQWIPSDGTDCLCQVLTSVSEDSNCTISCAAGLADASVLLLSASNAEGEMEWGIKRPHDQILLSYPAIGTGLVDYAVEPGETETIPHIAYCLRGSTTYLVPVRAIDDSSEKPPPITVLTYPHDIDSDMDFQRLQFFSAGCLSISKKERSYTKDRIPILIYAWPGGIIDIYACELLQETEVISSLLVAELVANGSPELLRRYLPALSPDKLADKSSDWKLAQEEIASWTSESPLSVSELMSSQFKAFRSILFNLHNKENEDRHQETAT
jgi:hypothetical protein